MLIKVKRLINECLYHRKGVFNEFIFYNFRDKVQQKNIKYGKKLNWVISDISAQNKNEIYKSQQSRKEINFHLEINSKKSTDIRQVSQKKVNNFVSNISVEQSNQNSRYFIQFVSNILDKYQAVLLLTQVQQYLSKVNTIKDKTIKEIWKKRKIYKVANKLFENIGKMIMSHLQNDTNTNIILQLLSKSNPKLIKDFFLTLMEQNKKPMPIEKSQVSLINFKTQEGQQFHQSQLNSDEVWKSKINLANQFVDQLSNSKKQQYHKKITKLRMKIIGIKAPELQSKQQLVQSNSKIMVDNVIFVKDRQKSGWKSLEDKNFGKNWVYGYNLPYDLDQQSVNKFLKFINSYYGRLEEVVLFPYKNSVNMKQQTQIAFQIPENFQRNDDDKQQRIKRLKVIVPSSAKKKSPRLMTLLDKVRSDMTQKFNKSTILLKFQKYQHKLRLTSPEIRLFGLNYQHFKNIYFQNAEYKNMLILKMVPWCSSSVKLLKVINEKLRQINLFITYQSCLLTKFCIFIQFDNFYQCFHARKLLDHLQFQNYNLKAQLTYGALKVHQQIFSDDLVCDQYQSLVQKLENLQCFYNEINR